MGAPETDRIRDTYFSLWKMTDAGVRDPQLLKTTIDTASAMIRDAKGECRLYVTVGSGVDLIGVARGEAIDDTRIVQIQHAIKAFGTLSTEFIKAREFSLNDWGGYLTEVRRLQGLKS